jgi:hypothetical protein
MGYSVQNDIASADHNQQFYEHSPKPKPKLQKRKFLRQVPQVSNKTILKVQAGRISVAISIEN